MGQFDSKDYIFWYFYFPGMYYIVYRKFWPSLKLIRHPLLSYDAVWISQSIDQYSFYYFDSKSQETAGHYHTGSENWVVTWFINIKDESILFM